MLAAPPPHPCAPRTLEGRAVRCAPDAMEWPPRVCLGDGGWAPVVLAGWVLNPGRVGQPGVQLGPREGRWEGPVQLSPVHQARQKGTGKEG